MSAFRLAIATAAIFTLALIALASIPEILAPSGPVVQEAPSVGR